MIRVILVLAFLAAAAAALTPQTTRMAALEEPDPGFGTHAMDEGTVALPHRPSREQIAGRLWAPAGRTVSRPRFEPEPRLWIPGGQALACDAPATGPAPETAALTC